MYNLLDPLSSLRGKTICGIYLLKVKNRKYVGSSIDIKKRLRRHRTLLRNNKHDNDYLQNLYNKYKMCYWEILEIVPLTIPRKELCLLERSWIARLKAKVNLSDPVVGIGGLKKTVYQYTLTGEFVREWESGAEAARELDIPCYGIAACANPNVKPSKSANGFIWLYSKDDLKEYYNNTGSNLSKRAVHLYNLDGTYYKSYDSLSNCARDLKKTLDYKFDWRNIRSKIGYTLKNPKTRRALRRYKVSYNKANSFTEALMVS